MTVDTGDTAWILISSALVMLMTPALGFFYGGLVRHKNVLSTIMHSFTILALVSVTWVVFGYTLAFGPDHWGLIGGLDWFGLRDVGPEPNPVYAPTVPHQAFMMFQGMFAIITPALITGAFAERIKFSTFLVFSLLWSTLVYAPIAHWVWADGGWLRNLGALDFAGGTVVHVNAGAAALAAALMFGRRIGFGREPMEPHDITMVVLGAGLLWFGWFGFNAGSAIASGQLSTTAFVATNTATGAAALTYLALSWLVIGKPSVVGAATGAVAGLVAITPASGYVDPMAALAIGGGAGLLVFLALRLRPRTNVDDSLDVLACHGVGGAWGAVATGIFASVAVNAAGGDGLIHGNAGQLWTQIEAVAVTFAFSFVATAVILKVLDLVMGLRPSAEEESLGLDATQHGERAYLFEPVLAMSGPLPDSWSASYTGTQAPVYEAGGAGGGA